MRPDDDLEEINIAEPGGQECGSSSTGVSTPNVLKKVIVADTSPLNYLVRIECDFLLPLLYRRVITPPIVVAELTHSSTPPMVARWATQPPVWLEVLPITSQPEGTLRLLDAGERDAIQLAIELRVSEVLIDEFKGRREAQSRGFLVVGTLGVLIAAERARLVNAQDAFDRLIAQTNIYVAPKLREKFLEALRPSIDDELPDTRQHQSTPTSFSKN